jgi:hypothetical protein
MPDSQDFNSQKDINRYLQQQGRAPQSHLDWEMWRKTGQPGTYQAPPGSSQRFQGVSSGAGGPNYNSGTNHYNMFKDTGDAIASALTGPTSWVQNKFAKMGKGNSGSTASSRNGSNMADDDGSMGPPVAGGGRSQNASITSPASSRGMRRGRRGDFSGALAAHNITMVQGNDNYGTVYGNMGGANVGNGDYDNSFQSKNSGGRQTAFSGNNNTFNVGGSTTPPFGPPTPPTPPPPPPTPPVGPTPPPTPPVGPDKKPKTPKTYVTDEDWEGPKRPPLTPTPPPNGTGTRPVGPQTPVQGPQQPGRPAIGAGPQPAGAIESGPQPAGAIESGPQPAGQLDESKRTKVPDGLYAHANDEKGGPEAATARQKLNEKGVNGPWLSETAGPQAPAAGPMSQPVQGPVNPASKVNEQGGVGAKKYGPAKPKPKIGDPDYKPAMGKNPLNDKTPMKPLTTLIPQTVEGPKSVASKAPVKKAAAKTKEKK